MMKIWTNKLLPKALKSCPKSNKSPSLVTLEMIRVSAPCLERLVTHFSHPERVRQSDNCPAVDHLLREAVQALLEPQDQTSGRSFLLDIENCQLGIKKDFLILWDQSENTHHRGKDQCTACLF